MDRSFSSPFKIKRSSLANQNQFNTSIRSNLTKYSTPGRAVQSSQIVLKSHLNRIERFGQSLPVLVTEALTFAERNTSVSARISEWGFAWLVCGRRLLIWQFSQSSHSGTPKRQAIGQCFELQLPQSDLAHRAELVSVVLLSGSTVPACVAVSPEGVVRYWPAVAHEGILVEQTVDLQGQECDSLTCVDGLGCILATTTCTVALVCPKLQTGRHILQCRTLKTPSGWLGGIGRRMSSFIFGPISSDLSAETRLVRVLPVVLTENSWIVYVLAGHMLQKWKLITNESEQLIFVADLNRIVIEGFRTIVWENCSCNQTDIDTWLLDIHIEKDCLVILAAAVNLHLSPQMHYALIWLPTNTNTAPTIFQEFFVLKLTGLYQENNPVECLSYRFLICNEIIYVYNKNSIMVIKSQEETESLDFNSQDFILGGSICSNTPVFFSRNNGLIAVFSNDSLTDYSLNITSGTNKLDTSGIEDANNLTLYHLDPDEMYSAMKDTESQMKAAFIFYAKNQQMACQDIVQELFLASTNIKFGIDAILDNVVVKVCNDFLDDIPAGDPRWNKEIPPGLGSSYSMQLLQQLKDKQKALQLFLSFLKENDLWSRLSAVTIRGTVMSTVYVLGELSEKILAAYALKALPSHEIIENAIDKVIEDYDFEPEGESLTNQDIVFKEVTKIYTIFQQMVNLCNEVAHSDLSPLDLGTLIKDTNEIILSVLKVVVTHRQNSAEEFTSTSKMLTEYLPWTSASGNEGLNDCLMLQQSLTYNYGIQLISDHNIQNILYEQLVNLLDIILDGRKCHLESLKGTEREEILYRQYQSDKHKFIKPLIADKEWERAALLAEKYLDFETLVLICEETNNQARLDEYMDRFSENGFLEFVYSWFLQENKQGKLINLCRNVYKTKTNQKLSSFLSSHPSLSWIQNVFDDKFDDAADALKDLSVSETVSITRQKTMLSLCKLAKLAGDSPEKDIYVDTLNSDLEIISFQEDIPDYVLEHFGYDTLHPSVIPPKDLINLYICPEYKDATEMEFKKALDLTVHVFDDDLQNELRLKIWKNAIIRNTWDDKNLDSPLEILQEKLFFRLADLCLICGADPKQILPPLDLILEDAEFPLYDNKRFQYLLKSGYEYINKIPA